MVKAAIKGAGSNIFRKLKSTCHKDIIYAIWAQSITSFLLTDYHVRSPLEYWVTFHKLTNAVYVIRA